MRFLFRKPKAFILNDTRRDGFHQGCHLVMENLLTLCREHGLHVIGTEESKGFPNEEKFLGKIKSADIIILNGEGTLHHDRGQGLYKQVELAVGIGKPAVLINSVWQENQKTKKYLDLFHLHAFREMVSTRTAQSDGAHGAICVPDLSLYRKIKARPEPAKPVAFTDSVLSPVAERLATVGKEMEAFIYPMLPNAENGLTIDRLLQHGSIVGGRFHAMCIGLLTGRPMLAIESNTHKISALVKDLELEYEIYMTAGMNDITRSNVEKFVKMDHSHFYKTSLDYVSDARKRARSLFKEIKHVA